MFIRLPEIAIPEVLATRDSCVTVNGVGVADGWAYIDALKPGRILLGKAIAVP